MATTATTTTSTTTAPMMGIHEEPRKEVLAAGTSKQANSLARLIAMRCEQRFVGMIGGGHIFYSLRGLLLWFD